MTVDDLLLGDRPWRARVAITRRPFTRRRAAVLALLVLVAVCPLTPVAVALAAVVAAVWVGWSAEAWMEGGGHHPLGSLDVATWLAYDDLALEDRKAAEAEAKNKARARR